MKHILYSLTFLLQSCCAMSSPQSQEETFRKKLQHYFTLPSVEILNDLLEEEKQQYYNTVNFGVQKNIQNVWRKVETIASSHGILNHLYAIAQCTNKFARTLATAGTILDQEINVILRTSWIAACKISKENGKSTHDLIAEGLANCMKDRTAGKELPLRLYKKELLCYLLLAYGGAPNATFIIFTTLPFYTIVD